VLSVADLSNTQISSSRRIESVVGVVSAKVVRCKRRLL
jgi:hypothetical protein